MADEGQQQAQPKNPPPLSGNSELERLKRENEALKKDLQAAKQSLVADKGPEEGTPVCYQRQGEGFCRPAVVASEGFTELLKAPGGATARHALIEYGEAPWSVPADIDEKELARLKAHSFQTDRPWDPTGKPETWHLTDECPRQGGPGCPYAKQPVWPPRRHPEHQAP